MNNIRLTPQLVHVSRGLLKSELESKRKQHVVDGRIVSDVASAWSTRHLYSLQTLGIENYKLYRSNERFQDPVHIAKRKAFVSDCLTDDDSLVIPMHLDVLLHTIQDSPEDSDLLLRTLRKYHEQDKKIRLDECVFGTTVMRFLHFYKLSECALQVGDLLLIVEAMIHQRFFQYFNDPQLEGFFDQNSTLMIYLDLLYECQRYQDVLNEFSKMEKLLSRSIRRHITVIVFGACYKLVVSPVSTLESLHSSSSFPRTHRLP